jgi:hypothetical protein
MHLSHLSFMKMITPIEIQGIQTILVTNKESGSNVQFKKACMHVIDFSYQL